MHLRCFYQQGLGWYIVCWAGTEYSSENLPRVKQCATLCLRVEHRIRALYTILYLLTALIGEPVYETTIVSMQPPNVLIFHQLKQNEVDAVLAYLEGQTQWTAALLAAGLSAGILLVVNKSGRGSSSMLQRSVAPFIKLWLRNCNPVTPMREQSV